MSDFTIKEIYDAMKIEFPIMTLIPHRMFSSTTPLHDFFVNNYPNFIEWLNNYSNANYKMYEAIDRYVAKKFKNFRYIPETDISSIHFITDDFQKTMFSYIWCNIEKIDRYIAISKQTYDPLKPTSRHEEKTLVKSGEEKDDIVRGAETVTDENGARHVESETKVSPYDNDTYYENSKSIGDNNASIDKRTTSARNDSNTKTFTDRQDKTTLDIDANNGNKTQGELLESDRKFWNNYSIVDMIFIDFVKENCYV